MRNSRLSRRLRAVAFAALCAVIIPWSGFASAEDSLSRTAEGLSVYIGIIPAEIVRGHLPGHPEKTMHGGAPRGGRASHLVAAIFDAASGARVSDATVTAQISGLGLSGTRKTLDAMEIANTVSYGGFFDLLGRDLYTVKLTIQRPGQPKPASLEFKYDRRR